MFLKIKYYNIREYIYISEQVEVSPMHLQMFVCIQTKCNICFIIALAMNISQNSIVVSSLFYVVLSNDTNILLKLFSCHVINLLFN